MTTSPRCLQAGLESISVGTAEEYRTLATHPDLWHRRKGSQFVFKSMGKLLAPGLRCDRSESCGGEKQSSLIRRWRWARIAQDKLAIPTATIHLQPSVFRSSIEPAVLPGLPVKRWMPLAMRRFTYYVADKVGIDPLAAPPINALRSELGLPPVARILDGWWNSPQLVIGLFPMVRSAASRLAAPDTADRIPTV